MLRKFFMAVPVTILVVGGTAACASKKLVRTSVGDVNSKVDSLGRSVEETQERTRRTEGKITEVDQKAQAAAQSAQQANQAAAAAQNKANEVGSQANERFSAIEEATHKLVYEVVLSEGQGNFKFGQSTLPDEARHQIDEMVRRLKSGSEKRVH